MKLFKILALGLSVLSIADAYENNCSNPKDPKPDCQSSVGDPVDPATGTAYREVTDLRTYGAAPIGFSRIYTSRTTNFNDAYWDFGNRQTWQHNWNYEMRQLGTKTFNQFDIKVRYPDGHEANFKAPDGTSNQRIPSANNGDRLYKWSGSTVGYTLVTADGHEYDFWRYLSPAFHLTALRDGKGLSWAFTYGTDAKLQKIANSFGRWIQIERSTISGVPCISRVYTDDGRQVTYSYSGWPQTGSVVLTTITYPGAEQAHYTWVTADPSSTTARPLLETASDPMSDGGGARTKFVYNYNAIYPGSFSLVTGTVLEERNLDTNALIVSLPGGGGTYPQVLEGDGTEVTRIFSNGLLVETRDGEGRSTKYTYSAGGFGFIETMTEPNGAVTSYTRDYAGRILTQTNALGQTRSFAYDATGFVLTQTDELGRTTTTARDTGNRPTRIDYPDGSFETWSYDSVGQPLTHLFRNGGTESFVYDAAGNMTQKTDPMGNITSYAYYPNGLRLSATDARQWPTSYAYNWRGNVVAVTYPDNATISYEYDSFGKRTAEIDELGHTTTFTYDEYNRIRTVTNPLNQTTTTEYGAAPGCTGCGAAETISRITAPGGKVTNFTYDRSRLRTSQTIAAGTPEAATTTFQYDDGKKLVSVTDSRGKVWRSGYNALHRKTSVTDPLGNVTSFTYDAAGNRLSETRPDGGVKSFVYDASNRATQQIDQAGQVTEMTYDNADNLLTVKDPSNNIYRWSYDLMGRKLSLTYPDNSAEHYTYDAIGNLTTYTTRSGQTKTSAYDNRNRETGFTWSDNTPAVIKNYDEAGRLLTLNNSVSKLSYAYDAANRLLSEAQQIGQGALKTITYTYDAAGNRATISYPGGDVLNLAYNHRDQITRVVGAGVTADYGYDGNGNRTSEVFGNNTRADYAYDDANRLLSLDNKANGGNLARFDYTYNAVNNRTSRSETNNGAPSHIDAYDYDATDQVTQVKYNFNAGANTHDRVVAYAYDAVGNRSNVTDNGSSIGYTANNLNQYTAIDSDQPTYDLNGNLTGQVAGDYTYDAQNRLISATSGGATITFAYDARNRCVSRAIDGVATLFYYDDWNVIEDRNNGDELVARYVHGPNTDELIARVTSTGLTYYHVDALGSVVVLTGLNGQVLERYIYDIYGTPTIKNPANATIATSALGNRFLFTGREYLPSAKLYDFRNRFYSPTLGRFLQSDPIAFRGGDANLYRYVANNVTRRTDPDGLLGEIAVWYTCTVTYDLDESSPCCSGSVTGEGDGESPDDAKGMSWDNARDAVPEGCKVNSYHSPECYRHEMYFFNGVKPT
jgi:RHS repeat-associated protein